MKISAVHEELQEIGKELMLFWSVLFPGKTIDANYATNFALQIQLLRHIERNSIGPEMRESILKMLRDQGYSK